MSKRNKRYTVEFKEQAVRLVKENETTLTITDVAKQLGLSMQTLYQWVQKAKKRAAKAESPEQAEVERLRKELEVVKMERDFLKKATAYFAKESL
jgi:transposase